MRPARSEQHRHVTKNHGCKIPRCFIFVDVESDVRDNPAIVNQKIHKLRFGHVQVCQLAGVKYEIAHSDTFFSEYQFWRIVESFVSERNIVWIVAHNATYDFTLLKLWELIDDGTIVFRRTGKSYTDSRNKTERKSADWIGKLSIDNTPFIIECEYEGKRVNFIDSMNYFDSPLSDLAKHVGMTKGRLPDETAGFAEWERYCRSDVDIIRKAITRIASKWKYNNLGNWQETISGLSYSSYRHCHLAYPVRNHNSDRVRELEANANYGGECRAFYIGKVDSPVAVYDVSSLYPYVMSVSDYPCELAGTAVDPTIDECRSLILNYGVIIDATIETERDYYPVRRNGRTVYPVGRFRTFLAGKEAERAILSEDVREIHFAAYYHIRDLFSSFIKYWYAVKVQAETTGDNVMRKFSKLIMNSLYGKFAQKNKGYRYDPKVDVVQPWRVFPYRSPDTNAILYARSIGWNAQVAIEPHYTTQAFPAISAFVTAAGRYHMRHVREDFKDVGVYYQDTDSIIVNDTLESRLIASKWDAMYDIGSLRRISNAESAVFRGQRNYQLGSKIVASGVRSKDKLIGETEFVGERFERAARIVTRPPDGTLRSESVTFSVPGRRSEGGYRPDGWYFPMEFA